MVEYPAVLALEIMQLWSWFDDPPTLDTDPWVVDLSLGSHRSRFHCHFFT